MQIDSWLWVLVLLQSGCFGAMPKEQIPNGPAKLPSSVVQACWAGNAQWIEMFLDEGGSPNAIDDHGLTLFSRACVSEHAHVVRKIIEHKNFDRKLCLERVSCGKTPLMWAAWHGKKQVVQVLTQQKIALESQDENGCTALMLAAKEHELECLEVLLIAGANMYARNKAGHTIRRYAQRGKKADIIALLNRYQKCEETKKSKNNKSKKKDMNLCSP